MKIFGAIFATFGLVFVCIGAGMALRQASRIKHARPVPATVISSNVETHRSDDSTSYKPIVDYRYEVDGRSYTCNSVMPLSVSASHAWAYGIIRRFPDGANVEAYYDPGNPSRAFLLKQYSFLPYIFMLFPMIFVSIGIGIIMGAGASARRPPQPVAKSEGWFELQPSWSIGKRQLGAWLGTAGALVLGAATVGHYFYAAGPDYEITAYVCGGIYLLLLMGGIAVSVYFSILGRTIADARLFINACPVVAGAGVAVGIRQPVRATRLVESVQMGLVCIMQTKTRQGGKTSYSTSTCYEEMEAIEGQQRLHAGETLEYTATVIVPKDQPPSSPPAAKAYPRFQWRIRIKVAIDDAPDYRADFPITVLPA